MLTKNSLLISPKDGISRGLNKGAFVLNSESMASESIIPSNVFQRRMQFPAKVFP